MIGNLQIALIFIFKHKRKKSILIITKLLPNIHAF